MFTTDLLKRLQAYGADTDAIMERFMGDEAFYAYCFQRFFADGNYDAIRTALSEGSTREAFEAAHALKGLVANMGLTPLYKAVSALVENLRGMGQGDAKALYAAVEAEYDKVKALQ